jgi:hypothetical protein
MDGEQQQGKCLYFLDSVAIEEEEDYDDDYYI